MHLSIDGATHNAYALLGDNQLTEVRIEAQVYSKQQARVEFERFLAATDLPDMTRKELEAIAHVKGTSNG